MDLNNKLSIKYLSKIRIPSPLINKL